MSGESLSEIGCDTAELEAKKLGHLGQNLGPPGGVRSLHSWQDLGPRRGYATHDSRKLE